MREAAKDVDRYEICIENFLLYNFWMDLLILYIVRLLLQCRVRIIRMIAGALAASVLSCIALFLLPEIPLLLWEILTYGSCGVVMLLLGLPIRSLHNLLRGLLILFSCTVFIGGIYTALASQIPHWNEYGTSCVTFAGCGVLITVLIHRFLRRERRSRKEIYYQVALHAGNCEKHVKALWDTGNHLMEPISQKSVSVINEEEMTDLVSELPEGRLRLIPYRSVGCENGVLNAYRLDYMEITNEKGYYVRIDMPYIGIYTKDVCENGTYQMILAFDAVR